MVESRVARVRYGAALALTAAALLIAIALRSWLSPNFPPVFIAAVVVAAWFGGRGPGLAATALSLLLLNGLLFDRQDLWTWDWAVRIGAFLVAAILITELAGGRRAAEAALADRERRYSQMVGTITDGVWLFDRELRTIFFNQQMEAMLGVPPGQVRPDAVFALAQSQKPEDLDDRLSGVFGGVAARFEVYLTRADGQRLLLEVNASPFKDLPDGTVRALLVCTDVTERERASSAVAQLAEASVVLSSSLDPHTTFVETAQFAISEFADWCIAHEFGRNGELKVAAVAHKDPERVAWAEEVLATYPLNLESDQGLPGALRCGHGELITYAEPAVFNETLVGIDAAVLAEQAGVCSAIFVPMIARSRVLGSLTFLSSNPGRRFDENDFGFAQELARRAALAADNARLYGQAQEEIAVRQRAEGRLTLLLELAADLSRALSTREIVDVVLARAVPAVGAQGGGVTLLSDDGQSFEIAGSAGMPQALVKRWTRYPRTGDVPIGKAAESGEPVWIESPSTWKAMFPATFPDFIASGFQSMASLPLTFEGRLLGGISFDFAEVRCFVDEDRAFMQAVAHQCALALERARLYEGERIARVEAGSAEARYRGLFEGSVDAIFVLNEEGTIVDANAAALSLLACRRSQLENRKFVDLWGQELTKDEPEWTLADGVGVWEAEHDLARADGTLIPVETKAVAVSTPNERLIIASSRELTRRRMVERAQQALFASVSHDLKSPLAAISLQAQLMRRKARKLVEFSPLEIEPRLDVILGATQRMSSIIDELVEVAQLRLGHPLRLNYAQVDLIELARRSVEEHRPSAANHEISLVTNEQHMVGYWDAGRLSRVFDNLLSNAVKYSPAAGEITVEITRECDGSDKCLAVVSVTDHGIGIPAADLPHIFEHFRRGANAQDRMVGSGIGLAGVRQIVEQHGGRVSAESIEGAGSTVRLQLPLGNRDLLRIDQADFQFDGAQGNILAQVVHESDISRNLRH